MEEYVRVSKEAFAPIAELVRVGLFRTFPFHLHIPDNDTPIECEEVFVNDVLREIRNIIGE
jgi:hypothetical protein